jgi:hypothetical protein
VWRVLSGKQRAVVILILLLTIGGVMKLAGIDTGTSTGDGSSSTNAATNSALGQWVASYDEPLQQIAQETSAFQGASSDPSAVPAVCQRVSSLTAQAMSNPLPPDATAAGTLRTALSELAQGSAACVASTDLSSLTDAIHTLTAGYHDLAAATNEIADAGCAINDTSGTPSCP